MQKSQYYFLIIVQDVQTRLLITNMLNESGYGQWIAVDDGRKAVAELKKQPFDAVISDIELDHIDGWRIARLIRSGILRSDAKCPIIMIATAWSEHIANMTAREYGVNSILPLNQLSRLVPLAERFLHLQSDNSQLRLLVIEDDPEISRIVQRSLQARFCIDSAFDGESGLALWRQNHYDLVLLDMMLPVISGDKVMDLMLSEKPQQLVVAMTAHSSVDLAERLILRGAVDFLCKPFKMQELQRVCDIAIRRKDYLLSHRQFEQHVEILRQREYALNELYHAHNQLLNNLSVTVLELQPDGQIGFANQAWMKMTGYSLAETVGQLVFRFMPDKSPSARLLEHLLQNISKFRNYSKNIEIQIQHKYGELLWVELKLAPLGHLSDANCRISVCMENITHRKYAQQKLEYLAMHDSLTGLFNRRYFDMQLKQLTNKAILNRHQYALMYIDLDHFKIINDCIGHHHGDTVIKEIAACIAEDVSQGDILARLGGDEFGIIIQNATETEIETLACRLLHTVEHYQYQFDQHIFDMSCSIGVVMIDGDCENTTPEQYLMRADSALYVAKQRGRNQWHQYDVSDTESAELRNSMDWVRKIRKAIQLNQLELHLQPIFKTQNGKVEYYEALIRLHLPDEGMVGPGAFVPALEKLGETVPLDYWVIDNAIKLLACYPQLHCIGINLSANAFAEQQLLTVIESKLAYYQVQPHRMVFELTESISLSNLALTQTIIGQLQKMGAKFAIDDFGTGFSTFNYLKQLPADYVKVDGSFVVNVVNDCVDQALVHSIADIARALKIQTIAEFVENESTLNLLRKMGIDCVQGYHTGKPKPVSEILGLRSKSTQ